MVAPRPTPGAGGGLEKAEQALQQFDETAFVVAQKRKDLYLLLFCSSLSVLLELVWELIIFLKIESSSCRQFEKETPLWQIVPLSLLRALSDQAVYFIIFYVIFWKTRRQLQAFNRHKDIVIARPSQASSHASSSSSSVSPEPVPVSPLHTKLLQRGRGATDSRKRDWHSMAEEEEDGEADRDRERDRERERERAEEQSGEFVAHGLTRSHVESMSSSHVTSYVRSTLIRKRKQPQSGRRTGTGTGRKMSEGLS